ncbi:MAG TPA: DPP IV N-terminal domain-containing protein [Candidatus Limnocylindrales bacterium]|nr:DPP IV N-terminal domain-containing protein [Candidatus Limnocylindrales bacterium]
MACAASRKNFASNDEKAVTMTTLLRWSAIPLLFFVFWSTSAHAQGTLGDYQRAEKFLPGNARHLFTTGDVSPHWIEKSHRFWYRREDLKGGSEFILVDADRNTSNPAFDHARLAEALSGATKQHEDPSKLPFYSIEFAEDGKLLKFEIEDVPWTCNLESYECKAGDASATDRFESRSPDGRWIAYVANHNLFLRDSTTGTVLQLTRDGEPGWDYATPIPSLRAMVAQQTEDVKERPAVFWSPDSSKFVTYRIDSRNAGRFTSLQFVPPNQLRPKAFSVVYPLPGEVLPKASPVIFDVRAGTRIDVKTAPLDIAFQGGPYFEWFPDGKRFHYEAEQRGWKEVELREVDAETGEQRVVLTEANEKYVDPGETWFRFLNHDSEIVLSSERDGWNHLYLYTAKTGALERQLTKGDWVVRELLSIDDKSRRVFFLAGGREKGEDPYLTHLYSVGLDGTGLQLLTPDDANHTVSMSPDNEFFVDNASRVDLPGGSSLRRAKDGSKVRDLEQADVSALVKTGWKPPGPFEGKAGDGATDLYGLIWKPSNFEASKKYPIIEQVYTGPQGFFVPKTFGGAMRLQSMAEVGFIVVMVDGRGTTGRSRAFHEFSYHNLGGSFADHVEMIKQMAAKNPFMDITRVGIYGTSAGGYGAAHAILQFPEFYKVCVSISGDHDPRLDKAWWNEVYQGYPVGSDYVEQSNVTMASRLQGSLLLVHGDIDDNVHPVETMRLADALMTANKSFDMLFVPNMYHGESGVHASYLARRRWDYFVQHLLGVTPPTNFELHDERLPFPRAR